MSAAYKTWRHLPVDNPERKNRLLDYTIVKESDYDYDPIEHEPEVCNFFSCGKHLSLQEQLFGNYCVGHQK